MPRSILAAPALLALALLARPGAALIINHTDDLPAAAGTNSWSGGSQFYANPGTGGVGGAGDGYLIVRNPNPGNLGTYSSAFEYFGDWTAEGATGVSFWLQQGATAENIEIHFGIGTPSDFWQYNAGFTPGVNWQQFVVDFATPGNWTRVHGTGTFANALHNVDRILFRHDLAPYGNSPNTVVGDFALDRVTVLPTPGAAALAIAGLVVAGRRR